MFCAIVLVELYELYELTHKNGKYVGFDEGGVAPGLRPGGLTGDLGWNPLGVKITERRCLSELQNGRAAVRYLRLRAPSPSTFHGNTFN